MLIDGFARRDRARLMNAASRFAYRLTAEGDGGEGGGGGGEQLDYGKFYGGLSNENKEVFTRRGFDKGGANGGPVDANALFDTIRNQDKLIGQNNLAPPDMSQDDPFKSWETGRKALGIVDKVEDFKITRPQMPNGADGKPIAYDEEAEKVFKDAMVGVLPAKYAQRVFDKLSGMQMMRAQAFQQGLLDDRKKTDAAINAVWGGERDMKTARAGVMAHRIAEKIGIPKEELLTDGNTFLGSVGVLKLFDFLADQFGEGFIRDGGGGGGSNDENTPAGAKAAIARLDADNDFQSARRDAGHANHKAAVKRYADLSRIAAGG